MSKKEWAAVVLVILVGIILQIPGGMGGQDDPIDERRASAAVDPATSDVGPYRTVELDVTGMT
jgi:hypothetical protein